VKVYAGRTRNAAQSFASDLRKGKKVSINRIGRFDARVVHGNVVEARKVKNVQAIKPGREVGHRSQ